MSHTPTVMRHGRTADTAWRGLATVLLAAALSVGLSAGTGAQSPATSPGATRSVAPLPSPAPDALKLVTTTTVFADIVRNVAREHADVVSIIPAGVGPEDYEARPADAQLLSDADLIVSNGLGLDDFLQKLLQSGTGGDTPQLVLGNGVPTITVDGAPNPHLWLDPSLVAQYYVPAIIGALSTVDPAHAADYGTNGTAYIAQLGTLDAALQDVVATIPAANRKLVTFHDAFPYLAAHFGFQLVGVIVQNVGAEPTAAELAALVDQVKATGVRAVFSEAQFNPQLAQTLAQEAGITTVVSDLYTDALGPAPADTLPGHDGVRHGPDRGRAQMTDGPAVVPGRRHGRVWRPDRAQRRDAPGRRRVVAGRGGTQWRRQEHAAQGHGRVAAAVLGHRPGPRGAGWARPPVGWRTCPRRRPSTGNSRWLSATW